MLRNSLKTPFTGLSIEDSETTLHSKLEKPKQIRDCSFEIREGGPDDLGGGS